MKTVAMKIDYSLSIRSAYKAIILLGFAISLILPTVQAATYYKWVDDENVTHYSKQPPTDRGSTKIHTAVGRSEPVPPPANNAFSNKTNSNTEITTNTVTKKDKGICEKAKANLKTMLENARIRQKDKYGEVRFLSEEEKASETKRAQEAIEINC